MPTPRKVAQVAEIRTLLEGADIAIATNFQGMPVPEQNALRSQLAEQGIEMRVVKNTLLRIAAEQVGRPEYAQLSEGPTAVVVASGDPLAAARIVVNFKRDRRDTKFEYRRAVIGGQVVDQAYVQDLASVPPRDELLARIAGGLTSTLREFMGLLQATARDFSGLVEARAKQLDEAGS